VTARVIHGDCAVVLRGMEDTCVDLTVTSPPYDDLRSYRGYSFDFETIAAELFRVTKPGGVVVWVVGDATVNGSETGTSFRQALHFKDIGFNLHDTMIYKKSGSSMAGSLNCYMQMFEYMFIFTKGKLTTFNVLRDRPNKRAGKVNRNAGRVQADGSRRDNAFVTAEHGRRFNIWEYDPNDMVRARRDGVNHPAMFPEQLASDHIASWSNPGDTVLDPFMGSGTTGKMAALLGRRFIGIEIAEEYCRIAADRIAAARGLGLEAAD
jgi:DNA modification methylase